MNGQQFAALQTNIGWDDEQLARAMGTKAYVLQGFKSELFKIGGQSQLCVRMLADMPAEQRNKYLGSE